MTVAFQRMFGILERWNNNQVTPSLTISYIYIYIAGSCTRTCADRGEKDVAHASGSGSCPIFRAELRRLRGGSEVSTAQPWEKEGSPESSDADCQEEEGGCVAH